MSLKRSEASVIASDPSTKTNMMPRYYFPWKLARNLFLTCLAIIGALHLIIYVSVRLHLVHLLSNTDDPLKAFGTFHDYFSSLLLVTFIIASLFFVWLAVRYVRPLGRMIQRARQLRKLESADAESFIDESLVSIEEPGEWHDLERVLHRFHRDLKGKTLALSREREELSALIGAVSDAILAIDKNERPLFHNAQFSSLFRVSSQTNKSLSLGEIFRVPEVLEAYRHVLAKGGKKVVNVILHTHAQAKPRHFSISIAPLRFAGIGEDEGIEGAIGVFHDITELKASEQIRIEFVANASHELRTPLTTIKGYVDTLKEDLKANRYESATHFVEIISRNVDRLSYLVSDLLDLSALESGAELTKSEINVREVTDSALRHLEEKRVAKEQTIHVEFLTDTVWADFGRVEQVIVNLVHNAIKYTPEKSRIDLIWEKTSEGVVLKVRDNGPGIAPEHQARLFERFYRIDSGRSRDHGGTGLGLAIVKHIMLKHNGSARVQSRVGEGSEFTCVFPITRA